MNLFKRIGFLFALLLSIIIIAPPTFAQRNAHPTERKRVVHKRNKKVVVRHSVYRPKVVVVHHPVWGPKRAFNRRWVYFPRYNLYWDNWRNIWVFRQNTVWVTTVTRPVYVEKVNFEDEKSVELKENDDDIDDVYQSNEAHMRDYSNEK